MELRTLLFVSRFLLCLSLFLDWPVPIWYQSHSLAMAPEIRSSDTFGDVDRRLDSRSAMEASLQLSLLCSAALIAILCSHTVTTIDGLQGSFMPPTILFTPPATPQYLQDHLRFSYTARFAPISSHLCFQELATAAPSRSDSTYNAASSSTGPSTIFAPSDESLRTCCSCSVTNIHEHIVPGHFTMDYLQKRALGTKIDAITCFFLIRESSAKISFTRSMASDCPAQSFTSADGSHNCHGSALSVLPLLYADDVRSESYEVFDRCKRKVVATTTNPTMMVESFVRNFLGGDKVLGTKIEVVRESDHDFNLPLPERIFRCAYELLGIRFVIRGNYQEATSNFAPFTSNFPHSAFIGVFLKLHPFRANLLSKSPLLKMAARYFEPFEVLKRVGLKLLDRWRTHPVIHASLLKRSLRPWSSASSALPLVDDDGHFLLTPVAVMDRRMVKRGLLPIAQVLVQGPHTTPEDTTWEALSVLRDQFPNCLFAVPISYSVLEDKDLL